MTITKPKTKQFKKLTGAEADIPWNEVQTLLPLTQQHDAAALARLMVLLQPLAEKMSSIPYFASMLGKEDARSIANLTMLELIQEPAPREGWYDFPGLLKQAIQCDLVNQCHRRETFRSREKQIMDDGEEDAPTEWPDDSRKEPEQQVLQHDRNHRVRNCLQKLSAKDRLVIIDFYFRQMSVAEIAAELHCSENSISLAKRHGLQRLRKLFTELHLEETGGNYEY